MIWWNMVNGDRKKRIFDWKLIERKNVDQKKQQSILSISSSIELNLIKSYCSKWWWWSKFKRNGHIFQYRVFFLYWEILQSWKMFFAILKKWIFLLSLTWKYWSEIDFFCRCWHHQQEKKFFTFEILDQSIQNFSKNNENKSK